MSRQPLDRVDINLDRLAAELGALAGKPVVLAATAPDGDIPGELLVTDETGVELDLDPKVVEQAVQRHDPTRAPTPLQVLAAALESALPVEQKLAALAVWVRAEVEATTPPPPTLRPARSPDARDRAAGRQSLLRAGDVEGVVGAIDHLDRDTDSQRVNRGPRPLS